MSKKILIVDDEPNILILMEQALEKLEIQHNVEILTANNGQSGLEIIQAKEPDLVFLDIMMPVMTGLEVCRIVKQELGLMNTYIILLTAQGQEADKQLGLAMGADLYMTKPFRPRLVVQKSQEILGL